jgi:hypothetical protein
LDIFGSKPGKMASVSCAGFLERSIMAIPYLLGEDLTRFTTDFWFVVVLDPFDSILFFQKFAR